MSEHQPAKPGIVEAIFLGKSNMTVGTGRFLGIIIVLSAIGATIVHFAR